MYEISCPSSQGRLKVLQHDNMALRNRAVRPRNITADGIEPVCYTKLPDSKAFSIELT